LTMACGAWPNSNAAVEAPSREQCASCHMLLCADKLNDAALWCCHPVVASRRRA
jgi:hypothetical protein